MPKQIKLYHLTIAILLTLTACQTTEQQGERLPQWDTFHQAMKTNNFDYLITNSLPIIECAVCPTDIDSAYYNKETFFHQHLEKIRLPEKSVYSIYRDTVDAGPGYQERVLINYSLHGGEGKYNEIHKMVYDGTNYKYVGMFTVP